MTTHYDELLSQGIRVQVVDDKSSRGPFRAAISCGGTGNVLGGVEGCLSIASAIESGKKQARKFTY